MDSRRTLAAIAPGAGDLAGLLQRILGRLISIEGLLRSQRAGRPQPMGRILSSVGVAPNGDGAPRPAAVDDDLKDLMRREAEEEERASGAVRLRNRRHSPDDIRRDQVRLRRWLAALGMKASMAGRQAGINPGQIYSILAGREGLSAGAEERMRKLLADRGLPAD